MNLNAWTALIALPAVVLAQGGPSTDSAKVDALAAKVAQVEEKASNIEATLKSGEEAFAEVKTTVDKLAKIKVGGYVQAQWQFADSLNQASVDGGNFTATSQERLMIRRARLKTTYTTATSRYVLEFDALPSGLTVKDANAQVTEPWLKAFSATAGIMDRPFGFEVGYSSSAIEVPERTRGSQILMPGEKDLGAMIEFAGTDKMGFLEHFNAKFGGFTGMGSSAVENDNEKDYVGRVGFAFPFYDINLAIDGGFSAYIGKVTDTTTKVSETKTVADTVTWVAKSGTKRFDTYDRKLMGVDAQIYYDIPVIGGISLRGEYWWGNWPSVVGNTGLGSLDAGGVYLREVASWYVMAVQNVGTKNQLAVRYDVFDPNTKAEGEDIGKYLGTNKPNLNDAAQASWVLAWNFFWDDAVRFTVAYDINLNEETNSAANPNIAANSTPAQISSAKKNFTKWSKDFDNNQVTVRMQVKF